MLNKDDLEHIPEEIPKTEKRKLKIPTDVLERSDRVDLELERDLDGDDDVLGRNSRCVAVATFSFAPDGRKGKRVFKGKGELVKFRCSVFEKKLLKVKSKQSGLSLSEYLRRCALEKEIVERMDEDHITIYKMLIKYHNNFKWIANMYKKRNPKLVRTILDLADEIKGHLKKFQR